MSPKACDAVDDQMWRAGEKWLVNEAPIDLDRLMSAKEIADRFGLEVHNIRAWARRHPDKITTHKQGGKVLFLLREVLSYR